MEGTWRVRVVVVTVACAVLPWGAVALAQDNSTVTPLPKVTVALKVLNVTERGNGQPKGVAVLSMAEGGANGNRSFVWASGLPPSPSVTTQDAPRHLLIPGVTVASRLLYSPGRKEQKGDSSARNALMGDIPLREIEFDPVPAGDVYRTDTTYAQSMVLAWASAFVSLLQPASVPLGEYTYYVYSHA